MRRTQLKNFLHFIQTLIAQKLHQTQMIKLWVVKLEVKAVPTVQQTKQTMKLISQMTYTWQSFHDEKLRGRLFVLQT